MYSNMRRRAAARRTAALLADLVLGLRTIARLHHQVLDGHAAAGIDFKAVFIQAAILRC